MEINTRGLDAVTLEPWAGRCLHRTPRFKPGCTRALGKKAKLRSHLLRSTDPEDRVRARSLDRDIKRTFRRNIGKLNQSVADVLDGAHLSKEAQIIKREISLDGIREVCSLQVYPDQLTKFMQTLQPPWHQVPMVPVQ